MSVPSKLVPYTTLGMENGRLQQVIAPPAWLSGERVGLMTWWL